MLVVPRRLRPTAALLGAAYTAATGISTLVGRWHRPSDVVAAVLVVLAWAGAAHAIGRRAAVVPPGGRSRASNVVAGTLLLGALGTSAVAALALQRSLASLDDPAGDGLTSRAELLTAYGGGALGVAAVACLAFALLLLMLRSAEARAV